MTIIYFILILGIIVFIHELGHFIFAKKAGIYVYEFSLGMGPRLFKFNRKNDETVYSIRLFPIGGFVQMAGEEIEADKNIPEEKRMQSKTWLQRFLTIIAGVTFNFILAIVLLFIVGLINGAPKESLVISEVVTNYPAEKVGIEVGDKITKINGKKVTKIDLLQLELMVNSGKNVELEVEKEEGKVTTYKIKSTTKNDGYEEEGKYGLAFNNKIERGILPALKYAFTETYDLLVQLIMVLKYLITGKLSLNNLSGPIGIYNVVGQSAAAGFVNLIYLTAYMSVNVGLINIIPLPAFDGGRILFLIIEKIKGKPVNQKIENTIHTIGFSLLMILMILITYNDIIKIFK